MTSWNGGIDFYDIVFKIPVRLFCHLKEANQVAEIEKIVLCYYHDAMRGASESIQLNNVIFQPTADFSSVAEKDVDDMKWRPNKFRLFISHLSKYKRSATNLKCCLAQYGI